MHLIRRIALFVVFGMSFLGAPSADGAGFGSTLASLFEVGAKVTPSAVAQAKALYGDLRRDRPNDRRVDFAYALVLVNQHRYRDALPLVDAYLSEQESDIGAHQSRLWIQMQEHRYADALNEAVAIGALLTKKHATEPDDEQVQRARFLGTTFGYLDLVVRPGIVDDKHKTDCRSKVLAGLGTTSTAAFDEGRNSLARQLAELQAKWVSVRKVSEAATNRRREEIKSDIDEDRMRISASGEESQLSTEQLGNAQRELNIIRQQLATLGQDRTRLAAQVIAVQTQISQLQSAILDDMLRVPTGTALVRPSAPTDLRNVQVNALGFSLAGLNKQAFDMDRKILALQTRAAELAGTSEKEAERIEQCQENVERAQQHAKALEKRLHRDAARPAPKPGVLTGKMTLFSTYAAFPYEREKQRVLDWFAK